VEEKCTGDSSTCPDDKFEPEGTACGSSVENACTHKDTCDGAGVCDPNNVPCSFVTDSSLCGFDFDSKLAGRQFNVIFTPDPQGFPGYKLNATNPGQFYYNAIVQGSPGAEANVTMSIPWPFITQGANPVHVYDADDITIDSHLCFREGNGSLPVNG